jgi:hypothetical protein
MGNTLFTPKIDQPGADILKDEDTLSVMSDPDTLIEPKVALEQNLVPAPAPVPVPACETVPIIDTSNVVEKLAESLSKSLPIDIPLLEQNPHVIESIGDNDSEEIASMSSISEKCGFKSEPISEESDLGSDEDVLGLDE